MVFKVTFADGATAVVSATDPSKARVEAIEQFPGRLVLRVDRGGLMDMARRPQQSAVVKPQSFS